MNANSDRTNLEGTGLFLKVIYAFKKDLFLLKQMKNIKNIKLFFIYEYEYSHRSRFLISSFFNISFIILKIHEIFRRGYYVE